jgi:hypothetical protein
MLASWAEHQIIWDNNHDHIPSWWQANHPVPLTHLASKESRSKKGKQRAQSKHNPSNWKGNKEVASESNPSTPKSTSHMSIS